MEVRGTLDIQNYFEVNTVEVTSKDPLFKDVMYTYMVSNDTAYIEMPTASGLQLLKE
jgi:glycerate kinase